MLVNVLHYLASALHIFTTRRIVVTCLPDWKEMKWPNRSCTWGHPTS